MAIFVGIGNPCRQRRLFALQDDFDGLVKGVSFPRSRFEQTRRYSAFGIKSSRNVVDRCVGPAGMHDTQALEIQPHRQRAEPRQIGLKFIRVQLSHCFAVLANVVLAVTAQILAVMFWIGSVVGRAFHS